MIKKYMNQFLKEIMPEAQPRPLTVEVFRKLSERYCLADYLTYRYIDEKGVWLADNPSAMDSYLLGFDISPLIMAGEKAAQKLAVILGRLPTGTVVHSVAHVNRDIRHYIEQWAMARRQSDNEIFDLLTKRRAKYLLDWADSKIQPIVGDHFQPRSIRHYWFIRVPSPYADFSPHYLLQFHNDVEKIAGQITSELNAANLGVVRLSGVEMVERLQSLVAIHDVKPNENISVAKQLVDPESHLEVLDTGDLYFSHKDKVRNRYVRILSAVKFPNNPFYLAQMAECISSVKRASDYIPGEFYAYTVIEVLSREKIKLKAGKKMAMLQYQTASTKEFWQQIMRHLYHRKYHVQDLFDAIDKRGETPVKVWTGMVLSAPSSDLLDTTTSVAQSIWKAIGIELYQETTIALPTWIASLPGQYRGCMDDSERGLQRGTTMKAFNAATLMHVQGDWQGSHPGQGGLLVMSRRGGLTTINLCDTFKSNYNAVMAASSGSGKSFMVNEMITDFLARGGMVRIIDAGRSYYQTAEMLGGQNMVFERAKGFCINPFYEIETMLDLEEDMETLVSIIAQMAFPFGFGQRDMAGTEKPYEYRCIENSIETLWQEKRNSMSVKDIADYFEASNDPELKKISQQLQPWAYGRYAKFLVGESSVKFNNKLLVLELDELNEEPELQTVVLNLVMAKISREMYLSTEMELKNYGRKLPKLIVIDEAWDLLGRPNTGAFIEKAYRRARKYECSVIIITQSFTDFDKTSAAKAALENSNWIMTLMHDIGALEKAIDMNLLNISEYSKEMIKGLQKTNDYSELYVINKSVKGEGLYRLLVDPLTYWTYTTQGNERATLNLLLASGMSLDEALAKISDKGAV